MAKPDNARLEETYFRNLDWIAYSGGWIHSNNVLFYFAQSPFFDGQSTNGTVTRQAERDVAIANQQLGKRESFEAQLRLYSGTEYVVAHDPLQSKTIVAGPNGPEQSRTWVIRKQSRQKIAGSPDRVTPLAYYYIINDAVFQAPSAADILTNRMLTAATSLTKMLSATTDLTAFAPSYGHTYFPPVQRPPAQKAPLQRSKEGSPMPGTQAAADSSNSDQATSTISDTQTLYNAIKMTMLYGKEYMDDHPLVGEPGSFRLTKNKEGLVPPTGAASQIGRMTSPTTDRTPIPIRVPSPPPRIQTDVPPVSSKKPSTKGIDRSPTTPGAMPKAKRRKSKANNSLSQ